MNFAKNFKTVFIIEPLFQHIQLCNYREGQSSLIFQSIFHIERKNTIKTKRFVGLNREKKEKKTEYELYL